MGGRKPTKIEKAQFEYLEEGCTLSKRKNPRELTKNWKRIGGMRVGLLKKFLEKLPNENDVIGVYVTKKKVGRINKGTLSPFHCKGVFVAPMIVDDEFSAKRQDLEEFP